MEETYDKKMADIRLQLLSDDEKELHAYAESYLVNAALSRDAGRESDAMLYASVAVDMKALAMGIATLPYSLKLLDDDPRD